MAGLSEALRERLDKTPALLLLQYLRERLGPPAEPGVARAIAGENVPPDTRGLAELLAERLDVGRGHADLELRFEDGRLRKLYRKEIMGALDLDERFDRKLLTDTDAIPAESDANDAPSG